MLRPYHGGNATEIRAQPKVYAFDTGFVAYYRGWDSLRDDDRGQLLEHLVLGELAARSGVGRVHYWRDKQQHEVDLVLELGRRREAGATECKGAAQKRAPAGLQAFRRKHPRGRNLLVTLRDASSHARRFGSVDVRVVPYLELPTVLATLA